jgi:hypothetical protein
MWRTEWRCRRLSMDGRLPIAFQPNPGTTFSRCFACTCAGVVIGVKVSPHRCRLQYPSGGWWNEFWYSLGPWVCRWIQHPGYERLTSRPRIEPARRAMVGMARIAGRATRLTVRPTRRIRPPRKLEVVSGSVDIFSPSYDGFEFMEHSRKQCPFFAPNCGCVLAFRVSSVYHIRQAT